jgi:tetratricopeptide (TPR) repeat protein
MLIASLILSAQPGVVAAREPTKAEPTKSEDAASPASALIERGIALRRNGDDAAALEVFQQAERLEPESTRLRVHLAATYQALGQWEDADRYLSRALEDPSDPYVLRHQSTLAAARETIDKHIGLLQLSGGPKGTEVRLNGRRLGTLPIEQTVRVAAGIYTLEAQFPGYYPVTRSVALAGGALVRESLELAPLSETAKQLVAPAREAPSPPPEKHASWLPWALGGAALGAGALTVTAWAIREQHATRWNDDATCLSATQTRDQLCGNELRDGKRAQTWMWIGGAGTLAFAGAAVTTLWLQRDHHETPQLAVRCGVGLGALSCAGHF